MARITDEEAMRIATAVMNKLVDEYQLDHKQIETVFEYVRQLRGLKNNVEPPLQ